jgi:hypothetical protein
MEDPKSWSVKDQALVEELIQVLGITEADGQLLKEVQAVADARADVMVEEFSQRILNHPNTREYYERTDVPALKRRISGWFRELFSGNYGPEYAERAKRIGKAHVRIGLPLRYPLAMWDIIAKHGEEVAGQSSRADQAREAFRKVLALSIALFTQAYEDSQLSHLSQFLGSERLVRRLLMEGQ